jgi:hypothetical protein
MGLDGFVGPDLLLLSLLPFWFRGPPFFLLRGLLEAVCFFLFDGFSAILVLSMSNRC